MSTTRYEGAVKAYREGRYEDAMQQFSELLHEDPHNPKLHACLGDAFRDAGQAERAKLHYQRALTLTEDPELVDSVSHALMELPHTPLEEIAEALIPADRAANIPESSDFPNWTLEAPFVNSYELDEVGRITPELPDTMNRKYDVEDSSDRRISLDTPAQNTSAKVTHAIAPQPRSTRKQHKPRDVKWSGQLSLKIVGGAIALAAIPVTAVGIAAYQSSSQSLRQEIKHSQEYKAVSLSKNLNRFFLNQYENAKMLGSLFSTAEVSPKPKLHQKLQLQNRLNLYKQAYKSFDGIAIFEPNGKLVAQSLGNSIPSTIEPNTLQRVLRGNIPVITKPALVEQTYVIDFVAPIANPANQQVELAIQARMPLQHVLDLLSSNESNRFFVVNADGKYVLSTDTGTIGKDATADYSVLKDLLAANNLDTKEASSDGGEQLLSYAPPIQLAGLPDLNWRSLVGINANDALAPLNLLLELCLAGAVLALTIVGAIAYLVSRIAISRIKIANDKVREVLADNDAAQLLDTDRDELETLLESVDDLTHLQSLFEQQKLEGQHLQQQRAKLFVSLQKLAQAETADLQISDESIDFLVKKVQAQLAQQDISKDISDRLQQLLDRQHSDLDRRQQQSTEVLDALQVLSQSNSQSIDRAIAQIAAQITAQFPPQDAIQLEPRELKISDDSIDALATRVKAQLVQPNISEDINDLVLQLIEQQHSDREQIQQQSAEILNALQQLRESNSQVDASQEPQELVISDASINSLAEKVQAQIVQQDISELLLQLIEQQQAEQEKLQQQSSEILNKLQELSESNSQVDASQEPQALTISDASMDSLAEKVQAQIAQRDISELLLQLIEQQQAEQEKLQQQSSEILNKLQELSESNSQVDASQEPQALTISDASMDSLAEKVQAQIAQRDISELLLQLIEQQQAEQEKLQQQSSEILNKLQELSESNSQMDASQEPQALTISDASMDSLAEKVQAQIAQRDISELLLQLIEQQQAEQEKLQQQSSEILNKLQELSESNSQVDASQEPQALTISDASMDSLAEKVQAQIAQRDISELLLQLIEQQHAEQKHLQLQSNEILNALQQLNQSSSQLLDRSTTQSELQPEEISISEASIDSLVEKVRAQLMQPDIDRDVSDILLQLIDQQHSEQERLQQQSNDILSAIQQLAQENREEKETTIPESTIELLISRMQEQFARQQVTGEVAESAIAEPSQTLAGILPSEDAPVIESYLAETGRTELAGIAYDRIRQVISQVENHSQQLADALHNSEQATTQISADAIRQVDEIAYAIESLQRMTASMQSSAEVTSQVVSAANTTSTSTAIGNQAIEQSVQAIAGLRATIATTAKKVKRLGESSQHISKVGALINEVAVRTNFLAINASLESSRVGANGRSFTNIAEEVGELATRSAAAAKEIEELIDNIQAESGEVINFMELGTTQVVECTQLVETAQQNLQQIAIASQQINQLAAPMSEVATSQTASSGSITNLIQDIDRISKRTTRSSQQLSQSLHDTAQSLEQLQLSVSQLELD